MSHEHTRNMVNGTITCHPSPSTAQNAKTYATRGGDVEAWDANISGSRVDYATRKMCKRAGGLYRGFVRLFSPPLSVIVGLIVSKHFWFRYPTQKNIPLPNWKKVVFSGAIKILTWNVRWLVFRSFYEVPKDTPEYALKFQSSSRTGRIVLSSPKSCYIVKASSTSLVIFQLFNIVVPQKSNV